MYTFKDLEFLIRIHYNIKIKKSIYFLKNFSKKLKNILLNIEFISNNIKNMEKIWQTEKDRH